MKAVCNQNSWSHVSGAQFSVQTEKKELGLDGLWSFVGYRYTFENQLAAPGHFATIWLRLINVNSFSVTTALTLMLAVIQTTCLY